MNLLDLRTVFVMNVILSFVCMLIFISLWINNRKFFKGTHFWAIGMALQVIGSLLIFLRGNISDIWSIVVANTFIIIGVFLFYVGLQYFFDKTTSQFHNYILFVVFGSLFYYFTIIDPSLSNRTIIFASAFLVMVFQSMWFAFYGVGSNMRKFTFGVGMVFAVYSLVNIIRIILNVINIQKSNDFFSSNALDVWIIVIYSVLIILLAYNLILLVNRRLLGELQVREEKFTKAFHSSPYAVVMSRLSDGRILEANDGFIKMLGYSSDELLGKRSVEDLDLWPDKKDREAITSELLKNGKVRDLEIKLKNRSGKIILGLLSSDIIMVNNESWILSSINDITDRKEGEEILKKTNAFMIDRELKMVELKNKIKELEEKNNKK
ncbi:MAG: PAS domain-containing protein [Minisyncoccota bacterium]